MTKSQLIETVYEKFQSQGLSKAQVDTIVDFILDGMKEAFSHGKKIEIRGFGVFTVKTQRARMARNPRTYATVQSPEKKKVHFKIGKTFSNAMNMSKR